MPARRRVAIKLDSMTYEEAAVLPLGTDALHFLRKGNVHSGQKILINGAGGSIGTLAVQLAKYFGAEVTAVDSREELDLLRSIGAAHVIGYTQEDFAKNGSYDVIFDLVRESAFSRSVRALKQNGCYLLVNLGGLSQMVRGLWTPAISSKKVIFQFASYQTEALIFLKELIEARQLESVIDRRYLLRQASEAHRYVEEGHKKGNVVIRLENDSKNQQNAVLERYSAALDGGR